MLEKTARLSKAWRWQFHLDDVGVQSSETAGSSAAGSRILLSRSLRSNWSCVLRFARFAGALRCRHAVEHFVGGFFILFDVAADFRSASAEGYSDAEL